jgi:hypothetical protein
MAKQFPFKSLSSLSAIVARIFDVRLFGCYQNWKFRSVGLAHFLY